MSKVIVLLLLSFCLLGCAPSTSTYMKPEGNFGKATIDGCGQIPSTFRYESKKSAFKVTVYRNQILFGLEAVSNHEVKWSSSKLKVIVDGQSHSLNVGEFKPSYLRQPCGGFAEAFNCAAIQHYYSDLELPNMMEASEVIIIPPTPLINGKPMKVDRIKFNKVTETVWSALNC
ncbi:hypothetical protein [Psychrobium sp. 1_MG-2023]|uniref:hypothetical protein n=1 Tax=Psychrobium sp. 1_MG-2023 TaxID=3062624 RepID=UPI0027336996|nr:hypothetical protein [Psychrobium sp. 1_MG-2023]MDP2562458.1 hypothetical protein [Psychrobium sp. 1_MG-2023]